MSEPDVVYSIIENITGGPLIIFFLAPLMGYCLEWWDVLLEKHFPTEVKKC